MKTIRRTLCLLLVALLGMLLGCALAETNPVNPYFDESRISVGDMKARSNVSVSIVCENEPVVGGKGAWSVYVSGAPAGAYIDVWVCDDQYQYDDESMLNTNARLTPDSSGLYTFWCVAPGNYSVFVNVYNEDGVRIDWEVSEFTVTDAGYPTVDKVVAEIAAQCVAAGCTRDYEKALWLHDYLVDNAVYDDSYTYYSVDGVLLRGTGVCDSYRKAYERLLEAVGIEATSADGGNHAWNQVKLEGQWCNIDVTWDDPTGVPDLDYFRYTYFGMPTELMAVDHIFATCPRECTTYNLHYFLRYGTVGLWVNDFIPTVEQKIADREVSFSMDTPEMYPIGNDYTSWGAPHIPYGLTAAALEGTGWFAGDYDIGIDAAFDMDNLRIDVEVLLDERTLTLPAGVKTVGMEAFQGDSGVMAVVIPDGAESIGPGAFGECANLWMAFIPDSVTDIAPDAFDGCGPVAIVCGEGSAAQSFAAQQGFETLIR